MVAGTTPGIACAARVVCPAGLYGSVSQGRTPRTRRAVACPESQPGFNPASGNLCFQPSRANGRDSSPERHSDRPKASSSRVLSRHYLALRGHPLCSHGGRGPQPGRPESCLKASPQGKPKRASCPPVATSTPSPAQAQSSPREGRAACTTARPGWTERLYVAVAPSPMRVCPQHEHLSACPGIVSSL